jgi:hypothetical protein
MLNASTYDIQIEITVIVSVEEQQAFVFLGLRYISLDRRSFERSVRLLKEKVCYSAVRPTDNEILHAISIHITNTYTWSRLRELVWQRPLNIIVDPVVLMMFEIYLQIS